MHTDESFIRCDIYTSIGPFIEITAGESVLEADYWQTIYVTPRKAFALGLRLLWLACYARPLMRWQIAILRRRESLNIKRGR